MQYGDTSWFPKPPPKPLKAPSTTMFFVGVIVVIGIIGAGVSFATTKHSKAKTSTQITTGAQHLAPSDIEQQNRQAFNDCMKAVGGSSISTPRVGRFGARPDLNKFRQAYNVCRAVLQGGQAPTATVPTSAAPPSVA